MASSSLRPVGLLTKIFCGIGMSVFCVILAIVIPLWPITTPLFLLLAVVMPFAFLGYRARGHCPCCGQELEVSKRSGGLRCRGCRQSLAIHGNRLTRI